MSVEELRRADHVWKERGAVAICANAGRLSDLDGVKLSDPLAQDALEIARDLASKCAQGDRIAIADALYAKSKELFESWGGIEPDRFADPDRLIAEIRAESRRAQVQRVAEIAASGDLENPEQYLSEQLARIAKQFGARAGRPGFTFEPVDVENVRPPEWIVKGLIERATVGAVYGPPSAGKSFFAVHLAASVATGRSFHGFEVRRPGPVLYMAAEGHGGLGRRFRAWSLATRTPLAGAPLFLSHGRFSLVDPDVVVKIEAAVAAVVEAHGVPALVIVDTWARAMAGKDENDAGDTGLAMAALEDIRDRYGCAVLIVHHSGAGGLDRARGSTAFRAALDFELSAARAPSDDILIRSTKMKDGAPPPPLGFFLEDVDLGILDEDGAPVRSAVLRRTDPPVETKAERSADAEVLRALEEAGTLGLAAPALAARLGRGPSPVRGSLCRLKASHLVEKIGNAWRAIPSAPKALHRSALEERERWSGALGAPERSGALGAVEREGGLF